MCVLFYSRYSLHVNNFFWFSILNKLNDDHFVISQTRRYHKLEHITNLPMSLTFLCVSLLNLLKNGFSWVSSILTSSMQTFIILA